MNQEAAQVIFLDTEFTGLHQQAQLISLCLYKDENAFFYAEFNDYEPATCGEWVQEHVISKLYYHNSQEYFEADGQVIHIKNNKPAITAALRDWLAPFHCIEIWADVLAYDWVLFCQLFGGAMQIPANIFYSPFDLSTLLRQKGHIEPENQFEKDISRYELAGVDKALQHHALEDCRVEKRVWELATKNKIERTDKADDPYSVHVFMLPFRWDYRAKGYDLLAKKQPPGNFDERTDLKQFLNKLTPQFSKGTNVWKRKFYRINGDKRNYNELVYYHAHAANNFFDLQKETETDEWTIAPSKASLYFELKVDKETDQYIIHVKQNQEPFVLRLSGISLHVLTTGVAILSYTLKNYNYPNPDHILQINEFGRRIYPPFLAMENGLSGTKKAVLADKIELKIAAIDNGSSFYEDFSRYSDLREHNVETHEHWSNGQYYNKLIDFPETIKKLFPEGKFSFAAGDDNGGDKISCRLLTTDRMYFMCWMGNDKLADAMGLEREGDKKSDSFTQSEYWYAFMFGDKSVQNLGLGNPDFMAEQILAHTYTRWASYGTLFGITRDSFVCLSSSLATLRDNEVPDLALQLRSIYYTMAALSLAQRCSVLRFSGEVATITGLEREKNKLPAAEVQEIYLNYIEFINRIYYREITPEIQGIELYNQIQQAMNIERDVKDLDAEINELHEYLRIAGEDKRSRESTILTRLATFFLPATLVFGILGANFYPAKLDWNLSGKIHWNSLLTIIIYLLGSLLISLLIYLIVTKMINPRKK